MPIYQQLLLFIGLGVNIQSSGANFTFDGNSEHFQVLTPTGANRNVALNAPGTTAGVPSLQGLWYVIRCDSAASYNLVVKTGVTTLVTLAPGDWAYVACGGALGAAVWKVLASSAGLTTMTLTGAISAASGAFTGALTALTGAFSGRLTTTDGVTGGNDRIVIGNVHTKITSTTLTNTTTETTLASHSLPANTIKAGTAVKVRAAVRVTGNAGAHTLALKLRLGGVDLAAPTAAAMVANDVATFDFVIVGRAAPGAAASVEASGGSTVSVAGTHGTKAYVLAPADYATNGALTLDLRGTWSAASASDIAICEGFVVDVGA